MLSLGYKGAAIKIYSRNCEELNKDFSFDLGTGNMQRYNRHVEHACKASLVDAALIDMTGTPRTSIQREITGVGMQRMAIQSGCEKALDGVLVMNLLQEKNQTSRRWVRE